MRAAQRQIFRIERANGFHTQPKDVCTDGLAEARHRELLDAIRALEGSPPPATAVGQIDEELKADLLEARKLKIELNLINEAIEETKKEIATLHQSSVDETSMGRVTDELSAIVVGTEGATEMILSAVEEIDQRAGDLVAALEKGPQNELACDIQDQVIKVFEACNFQDLTGQRITKVVSAFRFIEERVARMMDIWGGLDSFKDVTPATIPKPDGHRALLNGPALEDDEEVASQDDIDALFD